MDHVDTARETLFSFFSPSEEQAPDTRTEKLRLLIATDHPLLPELLRMALEPAHAIAGQVADAGALLADACRLDPDVILIDAASPAFADFAHARRVAALLPRARIVHLADATCRALPASAPRAASVAELARMLDLIVRVPRQPAAASRATPVAGLSARQQEVLTLLVNGLPMKAVARRLSITPRTVAFHKYRTMEMLGLRDNADLVRYAVRNGLLAEEGRS